MKTIHAEAPWETQFIRLDGNWSEGFTPVGPYDTFHDASEAAQDTDALTWIMGLQPAHNPPPASAEANFIMLAGNPSDGLTAHGPYPTQLAALEDSEKQWHDTWIMTLQAPSNPPVDLDSLPYLKGASYV